MTGMPRLWDLDDLAGVGDLAVEYRVVRATVVNWAARHADFPAPLVVTSSGPIYSRIQVHRWYHGREWRPGKHDRT